MKKTLLALLAALILNVFIVSGAAFAAPRASGDRHSPAARHDPVEMRGPRNTYYHGPNRYYHSLPPGYLTLRMADMVLYYLSGTYYQYTPSGYVVVSAPMGAVIRELPPYYKRIPYGTNTYYYYNNTYYVQESAGYTVVTPPPQVVTTNPPAVEAPEKTIVVTVPNPNGSYIPVTLEKYSDGYKGPNGEFYPDYPTIDQLKAMYSKASAVAERPLPEELEFQVPNKNGSFTKVVLDRTKDGYVGPEGEYYKEKPTMEQLQMMYGK